MTDILNKLRGGDLRSIGKADEVVFEVRNNPSLFKAVFKGFYENDPVVRMRSADVIEKVTRTHPELLKGYTDLIIDEISGIDQQEVCWHVAQIIPRLDLSSRQREKKIKILQKYLSHKSKIVIVSAMQALVQLAELNYLEKQFVTSIIASNMEDGSPAVRARGKKLLKRLDKLNSDK
jgi:hypothetical protein